MILAAMNRREEACVWFRRVRVPAPHLHEGLLPLLLTEAEIALNPVVCEPASGLED
jgi:hypothetical protein